MPKGSGKQDYGEPWIDDGGLVSYRLKNGLPSYDIFDASEWGGTTEEGTQLAARIVACVNACAGLTDEELKRVKAVNEMYRALRKLQSIARLDDLIRSEGLSVGNIIATALALADGREPERGER